MAAGKALDPGEVGEVGGNHFRTVGASDRRHGDAEVFDQHARCLQARLDGAEPRRRCRDPIEQGNVEIVEMKSVGKPAWRLATLDRYG